MEGKICGHPSSSIGGNTRMGTRERFVLYQIKTRRMKMNKVTELFWKLVVDERAMNMVEYALIGILVALAALLAFSDLGQKIASSVFRVGDSLH
jgi:Flp pilus assembly pilin Flp